MPLTEADPEAGGSIPIVFGVDGGLFGLLTVPQDGMFRDVGVVLCAPLGLENSFSYRPLRTLAQSLAGSGFPVLRFDWLGTGDSGELPAVVPGPSLWRDAVHDAIETLVAVTGVAEVALVGLRIGATFALLEAATNPAVSQVVLLEPYATGRIYLRELRAFEQIAAQRILFKPSELPDGAMEAGGFLVSAGEVEALRGIDLEQAAVWGRAPRRSLIVSTKADRATEALARTLTDADCQVTTHIDPSLASLWAISTWSFVPPDLNRAVIKWLTAESDRRLPPKVNLAGAGNGVRLPDRGITEHAATIETARGRVFTVICEPDQPRGAQEDWVVFLNAGQIRRIGPNRFSTVWARNWAQANLPSLRLDLFSVGDSDGVPRRDLSPVNDPLLTHHPDRLLDIGDTLDWLAEHRGARRFFLVGLCSGGTQAFQVGLSDPRVRGVAMINPGSFFVDDRVRELVVWHKMRRVVARPSTFFDYLGSRRLRWAVNGTVRGATGRLRSAPRRDRLEQPAARHP